MTKMKINSNERNRAFILFVIFFAWVLFIVFTLVRIQIFNYDKYLSRVNAQSKRIFSLHPKRGTIYDCRDEVLAISVKTRSGFLNARNINKAAGVFQRIKKRVGLDSKMKLEIARRIKRGERFIWVKRKLTDAEYRTLEQLRGGLKDKTILGFVDEYKRSYPQKTRAAHILGGVGVDEQGLEGIEYGLDSQIKGKGGRVKVLLDARLKIFDLEYLSHPVSGKDVYLTIDSSVQYFVERELERGVRRFQAKGGTVIVMDSRNGAILAMASYPYYRPERIQYTPYKVLKNKAVSFLYDPGSTFKVILAASALENKVCYPHQVFDCYHGELRVKDRRITDIHPFDRLTFEEIIIKSSNVGAARIAMRLGKKRYYESIKNFGFGLKSGIRLPAEEKGILNPLDRWSDVSLAYLAHGYEISVTPIQMIRAFNVIASGGYLVTPHILKEIEGVAVPPGDRIKILSSTTARRLTAIMTEVVNHGTGRKTKIDGIDIAGKTGTAQKVKNGQYIEKYVSSFGGFFPADRPLVTLYVMIDEPGKQYYGGDVAAPVFRAIVEKLMVYLKVFPVSDSRNEIRI
jgi:cell division protein FtsI (penicillin-binding protein 3)